MIYSTGAAGSPTSLKATIQALATANGWTLSGAGVLYKGSSFVTFTTSTTILGISACGSTDGTLNPCNVNNAISGTVGEWANATITITINTNPDMFICVFKYDTNRIQVLMFGDIVKIHPDAFVGGNFVWAGSNSVAFAVSSGQTNVNREYGGLGQQGGAVQGIFEGGLSLDGKWTGGGEAKGLGIPFHITSPYDISPFGSLPTQGIHVEIDNQIWDENHKVTMTNATVSTLYRSPNLYNGQAILVPINLQYKMSDNLFAYLGYLAHIRLIRIDNYELGDIITIGTDQWQVFPWMQKNATYRNGNNGIPRASGTLGFAIRIN